MTNEHHSTHEMVEGIHKRMDSWDTWRENVDARVERIEFNQYDVEKRISLMESKIEADKQANDRMYNQFNDSLSRLEKKIDKTTDVLNQYVSSESTNRQKLLWGFIGIGVVAVLNLLVLLIKSGVV